MVRYRYEVEYFEYRCQSCGREVKVKSKHGIPECIVCDKSLCYRCKMGGFCKSCLSQIPKKMRRSYEIKVKIVKFLHYFYLFIMLFFGISSITTIL